MAGDWIKVRVLIGKDPKVLAMADYLATDRGYMDWLTNPVRQKCKDSAWEHVAPTVIAQQVVAGLVAVWGIANEHGKPDGDDLLLKHAAIHNLDDIAGIASFGEAMADVGWVVEEDSIESDSNVTRSVTLRFPGFMVRNVPAKDRQERLNRERQARYRARKATKERDSDVTNDATSSSLLLSVTETGEVNHYLEKKEGGVGETNGVGEVAPRQNEPSSPRSHANGHGDAQAAFGHPDAADAKPERANGIGVESANGRCVPFADFWALYPLKAEELRAKRQWGGLFVTAELFALMRLALGEQRQSAQWRSGKVPHAWRWLEGERWKDQLPKDVPEGLKNNELTKHRFREAAGATA